MTKTCCRERARLSESRRSCGPSCKPTAPCPHRRVMHALDVLRQAGLSRVAFGVQRGAPVEAERAAMTNLLDAPPQRVSGPVGRYSRYGARAWRGRAARFGRGRSRCFRAEKAAAGDRNGRGGVARAGAPAQVAAAAPPPPVPARTRVPNPSPVEPPPTAAQAGQVLDAKSDVVDFGDSFVTRQRQ